MGPDKNIDKLIKKLDLKASTDLDQKIHSQIDKVSPSTKLNLWITFPKNKIMRFAAMIAVVILAFYSGIAYKNRSHQEQLNQLANELNLKSVAELMSYASLSKAFREGDMEALDKQLEVAEKKIKSTVKTRLTIDQLLCEFDDCDKIQKGESHENHKI